MNKITVCHCGKCKITCNKHGKIAKCDECGKKRRLGTEIKANCIRHICQECCDKLQKIEYEKQQKELENAFLEIKKENEKVKEETLDKDKSRVKNGVVTDNKKNKRSQRKSKESS